MKKGEYMNYKTFKEEICNLIRKQVGNECEVLLKTIRKNNDVVLDGLIIRKENASISPTIYLNQYYNSFLIGNNLESIIAEIMSLYDENNKQQDIDTSFFLNYQFIKDRIVYKIIHYDKNKILLESIPFIKFLDLAIIFYYLVPSEKFGSATILIYNSHLEIWEKEIYDLFQVAKENTQILLQHRLNHIEDILKEELEEEFWSEIEEGDIPMYVLTNHTKLYGAACMLYPGILKEFCDAVNRDIYILPSSVHEIIIIPKSNQTRVSELKAMVKDTNENHVEKEEILSYSVYEYLKEEDRLQIAFE